MMASPNTGTIITSITVRKGGIKISPRLHVLSKRVPQRYYCKSSNGKISYYHHQRQKLQQLQLQLERRTYSTRHHQSPSLYSFSPFGRNNTSSVISKAPKTPTTNNTTTTASAIVTSTKRGSNGRLFSSSSSSSSGPPGGEIKKGTKTAQSELIPNVALATCLFGFVTSVFLYSMNSVGGGNSQAKDEDDDPLAQLKAEAQEALDHRKMNERRRMSPDEIRALESGQVEAVIDKDTGEVVADADDDEIAKLEEEINLKLDGRKQEKKKPWWRFGF